LRCLRRRHERCRQNEDADRGCPERVTVHADPPVRVPFVNWREL
jgi:hypothetical protein